MTFMNSLLTVSKLFLSVLFHPCYQPAVIKENIQFLFTGNGNKSVDVPKGGSQWDLSTGHAFECSDPGDITSVIVPEKDFIRTLMTIGKRLTSQPTKDRKTHRYGLKLLTR